MRKLTWILGLMVAGGLVVAIETYQSVDVTVQTNMSDSTIDASAKASPVLEVKNPLVKDGVAYVQAKHNMGEYDTTLSTQVPVALNLDLTMGSLEGSLVGLQLKKLNVKANQNEVILALPAGNYAGQFDLQQTSIHLKLPQDTGIRLNLKKFEYGSLSMDGAEKASTLVSAGSVHTSGHYAKAKYKIQLDVVANQAEINIE